MAPAQACLACGLRTGRIQNKTKLRLTSVCRVANIATAPKRIGEGTSVPTAPTNPSSAGNDTQTIILPPVDPTGAPLEAIPAGEAPMEVEADVATAAITREIVFVASEAAPFAKTGGLGDVCGSLPKALAKRGHRVMVVMPRYDEYGEYTGVNGNLDGVEVGFYYEEVSNVDFVFVDHSSFHRPGGMYGDENGVYGDNQWRFKLLCQAALEAPLLLNLPDVRLKPKGVPRPPVPSQNGAAENGAANRPGAGAAEKGADASAHVVTQMSNGVAPVVAERAVEIPRSPYGQEVVFCANDWFAGLVPIYLAARYRPGGAYLGARCIMLLHNLRHQGVYPPSSFELLGLEGDWYNALEWQYPPEQRMGAYEEEGRAINTLKGAITTADRIVAVSPGYAYEVQTGLGGWGMEWLLGSRQYALNGVLNGIDYTEWNPATDTHLPAKYSAGDLPGLVGKATCKRELQKELGLPVREDVPLIAFIGRLDSQKGADLILEASRWIVEQGAQLVCLGTGDPALEDGLRWMEAEFPDAARGWVGFNVPFSHRLTAAADVLLMPSRFEPCGLNQMYAMHYGTVPVAHATGGLRDTVVTFDPYNQEGTTGWAFDGCTADALKGALWNALETYRHDKEAWKGLQKRGMERDFTWNHAAEQYEQIFEWAKTDLPYCG